MNIHIMYNCYWGQGISGGDRRVLDLLKRWKDTQDYHFVLYTTHSFKQCMDKENIILTDIEYSDDSFTPEKNIVKTYFSRSKKAGDILIKRLQTNDIVYSFTDILPDVLPAVRCKKEFGNNIKWMPITHHIIESFIKRPGNKVSNFLSEYQQKYAMLLEKKYADRLLTPSPIVEEYYMSHGYNKNIIRRSGVNVDVKKIENIHPKAENIQYDACFLARLNYSKGIMELPEIWSKVIKEIPDAKLLIIGKGKEEIVNELKGLIIKHNVQDNIILGGFMSDEEAFSIMKSAKVFLFTSHEEGFGLSVAEAMLCNLPVVAYNLPVFEKVFKKGICLCKYLDTTEMANKVVELLKNDDQRTRMGTEGHHFISSNYDLDVFAKRELEIILEAVDLRDEKSKFEA